MCWGRNTEGQLGIGNNANTNKPAEVNAMNAVVVSAGGNHTCYANTLGSAYCFGSNSNGQLSILTTTTSSNLPVMVAGINNQVRQLAAGNASTCAITSVNAAGCWGRNAEGQLGDGTTTSRNTPNFVFGLTGGVAAPVAIISPFTNNHTCVIMSNGTARCWGQNSRYQVGDGSNNNPRTTPQTVVGFP